MFAEDISEDFLEDRRHHLLLLDFRLLLDIFEIFEKFSDFLTLRVFTLKPFPVEVAAQRVKMQGVKRNFLAWETKGAGRASGPQSVSALKICRF